MNNLDNPLREVDGTMVAEKIGGILIIPFREVVSGAAHALDEIRQSDFEDDLVEAIAAVNSRYWYADGTKRHDPFQAKAMWKPKPVFMIRPKPAPSIEKRPLHHGRRGRR